MSPANPLLQKVEPSRETASAADEATHSRLPAAADYLVASWTVPSGGSANPAQIGAKAAGLLHLPRAWVPPFLVLTRRFSELLRKDRPVHEALLSLTPPDSDLLEDFLGRFAEWRLQGWQRLLVRSNTATEFLSSRGEHRSFPAQPTLEDIAAAVSRLLAGGCSTPMCPLLQPAVEPAILGHLSNERRVAMRRNLWLVEWHARTGGDPEQHLVQSAISSGKDPLEATTERQVLSCLRQAAGHLTTSSGRWHCEWLWDGRHVWIVQADEATSDEISEADEYLESCCRWTPSFQPHSSTLLHFSCIPPGKWRKLRRPNTFLRAGLPAADVYVLPAEAWAHPSPARQADLRADLTAMVRDPVVLRTDISDAVPSEDTLLPTSPPVSDIAELLQHMDRAARWFAARDIPATDWAFLLAHLVPARASAMIHAYPNAQRIRIDALWGFPDGLLHLPHDTYYYEPSDDLLTCQRRYKGVCLLPKGDGWIPSSVGSRFDWKSTLSREEVRALADWGLRLAKEISSELQLMVLARIGGVRGSAACLPWHYTTWSVPSYSEALHALPLARIFDEIRDNSDLDRLASGGDVHLETKGYVVRPRPELLRDDEFLKKAAAFAARGNRPLYFEGSLLGHAYYVMVREGATVIPIVEDEPPPRRQVHQKLVRDHIPFIIEKAGGLARVQRVERSVAKRLLAQKLIEEAFEAWNADSQQLVEELCDVLDVVDALAQQAGITTDRLSHTRVKKREARGGFGDLLYLVDTTSRPLKVQRQRKGRLPLLSQDVSAILRPADYDRNFIDLRHDENPETVLTFDIPSVPPIDDHGNLLTSTKTAMGYILKVQYQSSRVIVHLRRAPREFTEAAEGQLELFSQTSSGTDS